MPALLPAQAELSKSSNIVEHVPDITVKKEEPKEVSQMVWNLLTIRRLRLPL